MPSSRTRCAMRCVTAGRADSSKCSAAATTRRRSALPSSGPVESSVTSKALAVVAAPASAPSAGWWRGCGSRPTGSPCAAGRRAPARGARGSGCTLARPRAAHSGCATFSCSSGSSTSTACVKGLVSSGGVGRQRAQRRAQRVPAQHRPRPSGRPRAPGTPVAPRAASSLLPTPEQHRGAHAFGGLGLHALVLERHAQVEVQVRRRPSSAPAPAGIPAPPRHGGWRAAAPWPATPGRRGRAAAPAGSARRQASASSSPAQRQQRVRLERVAQDLHAGAAARMRRARCTASAARPHLISACAAASAVGCVGMQLGGLLEGLRRRRPAARAARALCPPASAGRPADAARRGEAGARVAGMQCHGDEVPEATGARQRSRAGSRLGAQARRRTRE